ncbi:MAG: DUF1501 domain-containing protein [Armatimonadetes bacterium]|nr:DUF1501 domain-containing protein [Armatimonadota bacterium]
MEITRRDFLQNTFAVLSATSALSFMSPRTVLAQAAMDGSAPATRRLVLVQLQGGNDGINTVIPYRDPAYTRNRVNLRYNSNEALPIGGGGMALHPSMTALRDLYNVGRVAVIQGVGYPNPNRSHFESTDIWETAAADPYGYNARLGWAGKLLDEIHDLRGGLTQGVSISDQLPLSLISEKSVGQTIDDADQYRIQVNLSTEKANLLTAYRTMYDLAATEADAVKTVRRTGSDTFYSTIQFQEAIRTYQSFASYPTGGLGPQLQSIAKMIVGNSPTQVYHAIIGGFDTHTNQRYGHGQLLKNLSDSLAAFYTDMEKHNRHQDVTVITFSEFGRRTYENGSSGTDHGAASVMFVTGGLVKGGFYGNYPSLTDLDDGDLKFNVDFRSVYATLIRNWMGADATKLLGAPYPILDFFAG